MASTTLFSLVISKVHRVILIKLVKSVFSKDYIGLVLILCLLLTEISNSMEYYSTDTLRVDKSEISINKKGQRIYQNKPFSGEMVSYHSSGNLATSDYFVHGRREGFSRKWFRDGTLGYESYYKKGARDGYTRSWWFNGNPRSEFFYVDGKPQGTAWRWYRSGAKFKKFNYQAGKPVGLQQGWRENGKLFSNFEYKNGRIYGLRKANNCVGLEDEVISPDYYQKQANLTL